LCEGLLIIEDHTSRAWLDVVELQEGREGGLRRKHVGVRGGRITKEADVKEGGSKRIKNENYTLGCIWSGKRGSGLLLQLT